MLLENAYLRTKFFLALQNTLKKGQFRGYLEEMLVT